MTRINKSILSLLVFTMILSCNNNDDNQNEQNEYFGCCSTDPVFGANVDNLDQSAGEIEVFTIVTPNNDAVNDGFGIRNIELYPNHTVTIYNSDNEQIFESTNYAFPNNFPDHTQNNSNGNASFPNGTYRYKIVIENEETFRLSGSFCMFTFPDPEPDFTGCNLGGFDPVISNVPN
ncbi:gliding motility-associated C-terminal domain-containing protein [Winogradskyella sp. 3972H.M.0a.05]|uniref:T9SS type B sorting domain-containing protein n=1 Tax=Winogradskyella sp. 3972H.M.0a.05 TaxID=2950277 RepID=UPI003397A0CE